MYLKGVKKSENSPFEIFFKDLFVGLLVVGVISLFILVGFKSSTGFLVFNQENLRTCGDDTFYDACSLNKPYYCEEGILVEKSLYCGCPEGMTKEGDFCVYGEFFNPRDLNFKYFFKGEMEEISFRAYEGVNDYVSSLPRAIIYTEGEAPLRSDFKLNKINNEIQRQALMPLVIKIQNMARSSKEDQARIAISLVQNIKYGESNDFLEFEGKQIKLSGFPYQTTYTGEASCEEKSELLVFLLREIGFGTSLFYYPIENHESVGIKCPVEESLIGSGYCFVEVTAPSIITDNGGEYLGAGKLVFDPRVVLISGGFSLSKDMEEYKDAEVFNRIRQKERLNIFSKNRWVNILKKYGLGNSI